jgi:methylenetetrahydrofolate reductase (NADPH)
MAGDYKDALDLLEGLTRVGHAFTDIGIGGYPEGHAFITHEQLTTALLEKSKYATYIATQICFDANAIVSWAQSIRRSGVNLPIRVGMPGAVSRQKLLRISLASGVGDSVSFLKKQQSMFWRFFVPGGYSPNKLIQALKPHVGDERIGITDFHIFTFNELESTELWRQKMLQRFGW